MPLSIFQKPEEIINLYSTTFDNIFDSVLIVRIKDDIIMECNQSFEIFTGYNKEEIIGQSIFETNINVIPIDIQKDIKDLKINNFKSSIESTVLKKDGSLAYVISQLRILEYFEEPYLLIIIKDITKKRKFQLGLESLNKELKIEHEKLKSSQAQLIQSEKMAALGILLAGVAHEINNPMNYISSSIYGLENLISEFTHYFNVLANSTKNPKEEIDIEEVNKSLERIHKMFANIRIGVSKTLSIIQSLKNFSRINEGSMETIDLHQSIEDVLIILNHLCKDKIEIIKCFGNIPFINCYPGKINQVIMNILSNAIQAIQNKGSITITTSMHSNARIVISIKDTGCGISEENIKHIYDHFYTTKGVGEGTGLGLSIVYEIIRLHKGEINVKSELGQGTEFIIILPI